MCGILAVFGIKGDPEKNRRLVLEASKLQRHRGPDGTGVWQNATGDCIMVHERLIIVDTTDAGKQPFTIKKPEGDITWMLNSEIYNHKDLAAEKLQGVDMHSASDSAVPGFLYAKYGDSNELPNSLDGIFAGMIHDGATDEFIAFRDPMGICPMYWGTGHDGSMWFSSEMKSLQDHCASFELFPPGHIYRSATKSLERWYTPEWRNPDVIPTTPVDLTKIHDTFVAATVKRLMADVPLGILLSGGLDSSLVASVAVRHMNEAENSYIKDQIGDGAKVRTFSVGLEGSPDCIAARKVADFLGTQHTDVFFTVEEGIDALRDLIWHIESYEQVRAAVPMYLLARRIKAMGLKVVLSGEGADEIFGGYLYFHKAPNAAEHHRECIRKVDRLHQWDVLRANKSTFAWGIEARVPFLDKEFVNTCMSMDPSEKMIDMKEKPDGIHPRSEKYLLRKAFDYPDDPYLPESVLWRQKEQFSDGVGYSWVDGLKDYCEKNVSDEQWEARAERFPLHTPVTREYYMLRAIFEERYPSESAAGTVPKGLSIACSTPEAIAWDESWANSHEISGRAVSFHDSSDDFEFERGEAEVAAVAQGARRRAPTPALHIGRRALLLPPQRWGRAPMRALSSSRRALSARAF